ncbi:hypothetical protein EDB86DRAFT_3105524 [Lactarius hatsudake]|nr:hypothetical protein EDB86DRAFT_3105524 [Lactarius hatsudake]
MAHTSTSHSFVCVTTTMAQPQPNFHLIIHSLYGIVEQVNRIPNIFADLWNSITQYAQQNQQAIDAVTARVDALEASQQRIPMQLANATASPQAPIQYPQGVQITPQFPKRKQVLLELSGRLVTGYFRLGPHMPCSHQCASCFPSSWAPSSARCSFERTPATKHRLSWLCHHGIRRLVTYTLACPAVQ